jgi:DNA-directed RNA polymerase subunit F
METLTDPYDVIASFDDEMAAIKAAHPVPGETCPQIDKIIAKVTNIDKACSHASRIAEYKLPELINEIENELWGIRDTLEKLRQANSDLRELGHVWYDFAKSQQEEYSKLITELCPLPVLKENIFVACAGCGMEIPDTGLSGKCLKCLSSQLLSI